MGGTHNAVLTSSEYLSQARRNFNNIEDGFYISPAFLDKMTSEFRFAGRPRQDLQPTACSCGVCRNTTQAAVDHKRTRCQKLLYSFTAADTILPCAANCLLL